MCELALALLVTIRNTAVHSNLDKVLVIMLIFLWWVMTDSNCRPTRCKRVALPTELITLEISRYYNSFIKNPVFFCIIAI